MKIEYNYENKDWKTINEVQGILLDRKSLKENPKTKLKTYLGHSLEYISLLVIFIAVLVIGNIIEDSDSSVIFLIVIGLIFIFIYALSIYFQLSKSSATLSNNGVVEIKEDGIFDLNNGIGHFISWEKVDYIIIGKRTIVINIDIPTPYGLFFEKDIAPKIIKEIKKYKKDILVVDKSE